jgi:hypothetical protein
MIFRKRLVGSLSLILLCVAALVLAACSVNVKKSEDGQDKNVDIKTPVGGIHVSKSADVKDTGLSLYPGARLVEKEDDGDEKSANVNINSPLFSLKVVAQVYRSEDPPDKLISYYSNELKKYGKVLECHGKWHGKDVNVRMGRDSDKGSKSKELTCDDDHGGKAVELKVGTEDHQRIVAIEPEGKGTKFALVFVHARSKDDSI